MRVLLCCLLVSVALLARAQAQGEADIEVVLDLTAQRATLYMDGDVLYTSPISSGREGHATPVGEFEVIEKDINHHSNLYGKIVDKSGSVVRSSADFATPVPRGCRFEQAPMRFFMRFDGAAGMHAGILPGYPASHGCVRMPAEKAKLFYDIVQVGTPVYVEGTPPWRSGHSDRADSSSHEAHPSHPRSDRPAPPAPTPAPSAPAEKHPFFLHWL
jgi:hypothetical protein